MTVGLERKQGSPRQDRRSRSIPLVGILFSDLLAFTAGAIIQLAMVWWVLEVYAAPILLSVLSICMLLPLNVGVMVSGLLVGRFGARRLLLLSKAAALLGAIACTAMLAAGLLTIEALLVLAVLTYGAIAPSMTADVSRVPALAQFAGWRLATFHAANHTVMVLARLVGLGLAGVVVEVMGEAATVGLATILLAVSLLVTFASFPRDRPGRKSSVTAAAWLTLTRSVLTHEALKKIGLVTILGVSLLMAVWGALVDVVLPLTVRTAHLPATFLSALLAACAVTSVIGAAAYRLIDGHFSITRLARVLVWVFMLALVVAALDGHLAAIAVSTAVCAATGAFLATGLRATMQGRMPNSLQAHMIGLWETVVLSTDIVCLIVAGAAGSISLSAAIWTLSGISLAVAGAIVVSLSSTRNSGQKCA